MQKIVDAANTLIDGALSKITMYRLTLYVLAGLVGVAAVFGGVGWVPYSPLAIAFSTLVLVVVSWASNMLLGKLFRAQTNVESAYITALILALIVSPALPNQTAGVAFLIWAAVLAMTSKYVLAIGRRHIFNPAAIAVVITAFALGQSATWWACGTKIMLPFVVIGGLMIVKKIQRFDLALSFLAAALVSIVLTASGGSTPLVSIEKAITHAPIFFFAFIMLTEPLTTPPRRTERIIYGVFTGILFAPQIHVGTVYSTPELALIAGNLLSYFLDPTPKHMLKLIRKEKIAGDIYDFVFEKEKSVKFEPGQYFEWTLAHNHPDSRGNRRYFTIASSPTENNVRLGVKFYDKPSSFKASMLTLNAGDKVLAGGLAGDFVMPKDKTKRLAFIAGGIGITPFRSMIQAMVDGDEARTVTLLYSNRTAEEIAYREVFEDAKRKMGLKTIYAITDASTAPTNEMHQRRIDAALISMEIPDYKDRIFYISGTHGMVVTFTETLATLGVPKRQIKTDFFPGF